MRLKTAAILPVLKNQMMEYSQASLSPMGVE